MANVADLLNPDDGSDDVHVDVRSDEDVQRWSRKLGVSAEEFRKAAIQAGPRLGDIRQHLVGGFTGAGPTS